MTAYTSANFQNLYYQQEGEILTAVFTLAKLNVSDTFDLTPIVKNGRKVSRLTVVDHAATITGGRSTATYASSEAAWSMAVSTDIVTITRGNQSSDAIITVETVPS